MKRKSIKIISITLSILVVYSQLYTSFAYENLNPALVSNDMGTGRRKVKRDIAEKTMPDAIGNGPALVELLSKLPDRIPGSEEEFPGGPEANLILSVREKVQESLQLAIDLHLARQHLIESNYNSQREQTLANLLDLQTYLHSNLYLFNDDIRGKENYLVGFRRGSFVGLTPELINYLYMISPLRLAQYIYHESIPERNVLIDETVKKEDGRDDHRTVISKLQVPVFGKTEVELLKEDIRDFIDMPELSKELIHLLDKAIQQGKDKEIEEFEASIQKAKGTAARIAKITTKFNPIIHRVHKLAEQLAGQEESIGVFGNGQELWDKIVELYHGGEEPDMPFRARERNISYIVFVPRDAYEENSIEGQYNFRPNDVIGPRGAVGIDHGGWAPMPVTKRSMHMIMTYLDGPGELFVDRWSENMIVAKVVPIKGAIDKDADAEPAIVDADLSELQELRKLKGYENETGIRDEEIAYQAEVFKHHIIQILQKNPDEIMAIALDTDIGIEQQSQIMPIWTAVDQIADMKDAAGKPLFPNLRKVRGRGSDGTLMRKIQEELIDNTDITFDKGNLFLIGRQANINSAKFDSLKGTSWITGIDDSNAGREGYLPVFEAITLSIMAALNADVASIKTFYDSISDKPISIETLRKMISEKLIYILPKMTRQTKNLRELYESVRTIYLSA